MRHPGHGLVRRLETQTLLGMVIPMNIKLTRTLTLPLLSLLAISGIALADISGEDPDAPANGPGKLVARGVTLADSKETVYRGDQEATGSFRNLFDDWYLSPENDGLSSDYRARLELVLEAKAITPTEYKVRCTERLCRGWFRFRSQKQLYQLSEARQANMQLAVAYPYFRAGQYEVSAYWPANPNSPLREPQ